MAWRDSYEAFTVAQAKQGTYCEWENQAKKKKTSMGI